jgi:hypothetical protein
MVTRKAIIIGSPGGYRGLKFLKGVSVDLDNYYYYLTSKAGGQWYRNEVVLMRDPDSATVRQEIKSSNADYTFVAFSGHGFINTFTNTDYVCLRDKDFSVGELVSPADKQTIAVDACREYFTQIPDDLLKGVMNESRLFSAERDTRGLFDAAIENMPKGILLVYSTQPNESAGDDEHKGGHFTYSFIKSGREWWNNSSSSGILRIDAAVTAAERIIKTTFLSNQKPEMGGQIRRLTFPPFAFSKR